MKRFTITVLSCVVVLFLAGFAVYFQSSAQHHKGVAGLASEASENSPLASATVTFGGWMANPHLCPPANSPCPVVDRFANNAATQFPRFSNHHVLAPRIATIKAGGYVNFIIGGLHVVTVYDDGTQPEDIDTTILVPDRPPMTPPIVNDSEGRIYRGLDPFLLPPTSSQDRVEVVQFDRPGTYLVICSVLPHFQEGMYGYVRVLPAGKE